MLLLRHEQQGLGEFREPGSDRIHATEPVCSVLDWTGEATPSSTLILSDQAGHSTQNPDDDAESWLRSWSQSGWERFDIAYREASRVAMGKDMRLVIRPSSTGMLSDAVCTLNWCTRGAGQDAQLLLDPVGWLVPSMMRDLADHLDRIVELCLQMLDHGRVWGVLLRTVPAAIGESDDELILTKLAPLMAQSPRCVVASEADLPRIEALVGL